MKVALIGYGKMGKEIEPVLVQRGHVISGMINSGDNRESKLQKINGADVAIEFSRPEAVVENIHVCLDAGIPVVVGTTGWYDHFEGVSAACKKKNGAVFHASNFSVGMNIFFKINKQLASIMNAYQEYDVSMEEIHHIHKLDKPSGTAITLAKQIIAGIERKKRWSIADKDKETLFIKDIREGEIPGTHIVKYHSAVDDIEIMHKAHNRKGFALGAVLAAEFLKGKKGMYAMDNLISST
jgi:4-hydroxy-tetrahydrodipicolinate reductase